jgi:hypothetical protein
MTDFSNIGTVYTKINTGYPKFGEKNRNRSILIFLQPTEFLNTAYWLEGPPREAHWHAHEPKATNKFSSKPNWGNTKDKRKKSLSYLACTIDHLSQSRVKGRRYLMILAAKFSILSRPCFR